jgi:Ca2+-binding RTX toxin-like protein
MAEIYNYDANKLISGTSDNDQIYNGKEENIGYRPGGDKVTIKSRAGNDFIYNYSNDVSIDSGADNDIIEHHGSKANIISGSGNDSILTGGNDPTISTGSGNDTVYNVTGYRASINTGDGDDVITNGDYIFHYDNITIMAGRGNDTINLSQNSSFYNVLQYVSGDGNDTVYGYSSTDKIQIINGSYTTSTSGNDVIISVENGKITLKDAKNKNLDISTTTMDIDDRNDDDDPNKEENIIRGTADDDTIENSRDAVKIEALAGNDTVENTRKNVTISAGDGDDSIHNTGSQVTIDGGNGDDTVINSGDSVSIIGGANDDSIINYGDSTTIKGGTGTDTIRLVHLVRSSEFSCNTLIQYSLGDGNDTILDIASTDLIHITNGSYSTQVSDNDLIIKVGEDSITLKDAADRRLQIKNASGEIETVNPNGIVYYCNNTANTQILGSSHADTIYNVAPKVTIETGEGNNVIYNRSDNHYSPSLTSILVGSGDNIISNYNADQVTIKTGNGNNQISNWNGNKVTIQSGAGDDTISNNAEYAGNVSTAIIETGDGNDIISNGLYFSKVTIDAGTGNDSISNSGNNISISGGNGDDTVQIKSESNNTTANGGQGSDTFTINLSTYSGQPRTSESAMIQDYESGKDKIVLEEASIASYSISGSDVILTIKSENISDYKLTLKNLKGKEVTFTDSDGNTTTQIYKNDDEKDNNNSIFNSISNILKELSSNELVNFIDTISEATYELTKLDPIKYPAGLIHESISYVEDLYDIFHDPKNNSVDAGDLLGLSSSSIAVFKSIYENLDTFSGATNTAIWGNAAKRNVKVLALASDILGLISSYFSASTNLTEKTARTAIADYLDATGENLGNVLDDAYDLFVINQQEAGPWNAMNVYVALFEAGIGTIEQAIRSSEKYYAEDGKWDLNDTAKTLLDSSMAGLYGISHKLSAGLDDVILGWIDEITGGNKDSELNYFQKAATGYAILGNNIGAALAKFGLSIGRAIGNFWNQLNAFGYSIGVEAGNAILNVLNSDLKSSNNVAYITESGELNNLSNETQNIDFSNTYSPRIILLSGGNQNIQLNNADGNVAIVGETATGRKNIIFGKGDDLGIFTSSNANVKVTVGSGYDSIVVDNNARVNVDMAKADDAIIIANDSKVTLTNYDASSNAGILVSDVEDIISSVKDNSIQLVNDEVQLDSSTSVKISDRSKDHTIINLITDDGDIQKVGFTGSNGGSLDSSKLNGDLLLKGNYAETSSDKQNSHGSNIIAGKGNDSIIAGARDTVNGGSGHNQILLTPHNLRENKSGATIVLSDKGRNTVQGFHAGFESDSDCIKVDTISDIEFDFKNDGLILTYNDSRLLFDGIGTTESEEHEKISLLEGDSTVDAAIAQTNQSISVNDDTVPDAFFGNRSALNFNDYNGDININLAKEKGTFDGTDSIIKGFNKLQAGDGRNTLIGSNSNETLIAGNGYTSMWGGAGNDKLFGKSDSENKGGFTTFFFNSGDDHDTIADFEFITQDNRDGGTADKIDIANNVVTDVYRSGSDVVLQINDSSDYLTIKDAYGKDFQINNLIAKVDRNITYDGLANYYVADGGSSLTVDSSVDSAEIWLDNSHGTTFIGNIRTLDVSAVEGETSLVGNANDNTIIAGKSDASLWGGFSPADDLLIGGNSHNTFFYCNGNGHDTIQGTNNGDSVILSDISLNQITGTKITADAVSIDFINGGSLQINGSSDITYQLADGSKFFANHERLEWNYK